VAERRKYTKRQKMTAVIAAEMSTVAAAAEAKGIPERTLGYWFDSPDFAEVRAKTREDLAAESMGMAHTVLGEIKRRLPEFEPRDLSILYGILTDKGQLLSGQATGRLETKDVTDTLDDHERTQLRDAIEDWLKVPVVPE
jgi:hypothetical protein